MHIEYRFFKEATQILVVPDNKEEQVLLDRFGKENEPVEAVLAWSDDFVPYIRLVAKVTADV